MSKSGIIYNIMLENRLDCLKSEFLEDEEFKKLPGDAVLYIADSTGA